MLATVIAIIGLALVASFLTGIHDSSNIATAISSRAIPPRTALIMTAVAEFVGPLIFGVGVAKTIGINVVAPEEINLKVLLAAMISAVFWILLTWWLSIPSSYTHALVGGFVGSVVVEAGWHALQLHGIVTILIGLFVAPVLGFGISWLLLTIILLLSWNTTPRINLYFKRSQIISVIAMALGQGTNDSSKSMGIISLALIIAGYLRAFSVPLWVILICSGALAFGTGLGGMRLIRTVGAKIYKVQPVDAFASQLASALVIISASLTGSPVSTTQVVSSSVIGVGAAERVNKVRWMTGRDIAISWLLTIPSSALISAGLYWLFSRIAA